MSEQPLFGSDKREVLETIKRRRERSKQQRVAELEQKLRLSEMQEFDTDSALGCVQKERDKLAAALEWYADPSNWQILRDTPKSRRIDFDNGQRARQGLGREP